MQIREVKTDALKSRIRTGSKYQALYAALRKLDMGSAGGLWVALESKNPQERLREKLVVRQAVLRWCERNNRTYETLEIVDDGTAYVQIRLLPRVTGLSKIRDPCGRRLEG